MFGCFADGFMGGGGWPGMALVFLLLLAAVWACNLLRSRRQSRGDRRDSLEILKRRLAAGEISLEEYENLKKVL